MADETFTLDEPETYDLPSVLAAYMVLDGYGPEEVTRLIDTFTAQTKADGVREAADNLYLSDVGQHNEHAKTWLHRRANLIDPRTRGSVCEHGNPTSGTCDHCAIESTFRPGDPDA